MADDRNAPATKGDIEDLRGEMQDLRGEMKESAAMLRSEMQHIARRADRTHGRFRDTPAPSVLFVRRIESDEVLRSTSRTVGSLKQRLAHCESRLMEVERQAKHAA